MTGTGFLLGGIILALWYIGHNLGRIADALKQRRIPLPKGYYPNSLDTIERALRERFPGVESDGGAIITNAPAYLLWMVEQVRGMDSSSYEEAAKAGRWLGYIFRGVEELGLWDNTRTREITRVDVKRAHYDLPGVST